MPQVSVIMPAYNSAAFVAEAIESILQQSYRDFEFIIINDGSTDSTGKIIASFTDPRIRYYEHEANHGNNATRAEGLLLANGKYIAIMDSDDISLPNRLQIQVSYLDQHWETEILGGSVEWFGDSVAKIERPPRDPEYIRAALFFKNRIMQPTLMFRKESFDKMHLS